MIAEHAGGAATDGQQRIMDIEPSSLHQRTPLFIGTKEYVELAMQFVAPALVEEPVAAD
jgi:fructose-1,6-bisphosphatase I